MMGMMWGHFDDGTLAVYSSYNIIILCGEYVDILSHLLANVL